MIKCIAMDLGGVYFEDATVIAVDKIYKRVNAPKEAVDEIFRAKPKKEGYQYRAGKLTKEEFIAAGIKKLGVDRKTFLEFIDLWYSLNTPKEEIVALVHELRKHYKVIAAPQSQKDRIEYFNRKYNLRDRFDDVVSTSDVGFGKYDIKFYKIILEKAKCAPNEIVFIDDKQEFLDVAKSIGIITILFKTHMQLKSDLRKLGIKFKGTKLEVSKKSAIADLGKSQ